MGHDWLLPLGAAVANLVIASTVLVRGTRDSTTRAFAWMATAGALWCLDIFALYYFDDVEEAEWWSRVFRVGVFCAPVAVFHFTRLITERRERIWRVLDVGGNVFAATFSLIGLFRGTLVRGLEPHRWGYYIEPTPLYTPVAASVVVYLALSIVLMWSRYRRPLSARQREQAKLFFLAGIILVLFVLTNVVAVYVDGFYPLGPVGNVAWLAIIAYAMVRHRFMDLDYLVRKVVSFVLAAAVLLVPTAFGVAALARSLGIAEPAAMGVAAGVAGLLATVTIPFLQRAIETQVHRAVFAHRYDYRIRLRQLGADLVHLLDEEELVRRLGDVLLDVLELESCAVYLRNERTRELAQQPPAARDTIGGPTLAALEGLAEPVLTEELRAARSIAAPLLAARGCEVVLPLRVNDRLTGLVALGRNRDFRIVSREDLEILAGVASAASVALENARLSRELRRSETALERANRLSSIGTLAAGIAHEIRNPLTAVKTFLDLLPSRLDDAEFVSSFRELSLSELGRVTKLINELLAFGRSTSTERRAVELGPTLEQVLRLLESTAKKHHVRLELAVEPAPAVWADPDQVKQIVLNLVLNAIEASPADAAVLVTLYSGPRDSVTLEVRDHGAGIRREDLESIFHPFFTTKETGTGLGLSLVHQMVVEHGGEITVESELGAGAVFRVTLPVVDAALRATGT